MPRNFTTGTAGLIAVDKVGNEILFLDPITYEVTKSINGFAPNVHELLVSEDHTRAYVPIYGDGIHGKNPDPGHLIAVIDLVQQRHLSDFSVDPYRAPHGMRWGSAGQLYCVCENSGVVLEIERQTGAIQQVLNVESKKAHRIEITPDGSKLYAETEEDGYIAILDLRSRKLSKKLALPAELDGLGIRGGRFVFETANEELLVQLLPPLMHVALDKIASARVLALLSMNEAENGAPGPGSDFVVARLMELLLVELLRGEALVAQPAKAGMLQGLADPVTARALVALHSDAAKRWTTSKLARLCGCSRSAFNLRFTSIVGIAPMRYLHRWRMALAKDELGRGERSIAQIAFLIGFQSSGSFTKAFTRSVGCSPSKFAKGHRTTDFESAVSQ